MESALSPYRVLDLATEQGLMCGKVLADLGADVIKVEPPGGDPCRQTGPFYHDEPDPEKSLFWFALNANKRSVTLDIASPRGKAMLLQLVQQADIVVESFRPGHLDSLGLGSADLRNANARVILVSISPFGQTGPYAQYETTDLVAMAMGGFLYTTGDVERPPVRISYPQAYFHAGAEGAVAALMAIHHRKLTGEGQHLDVSIQECVVWTLMNTTATWDLNRVNVTRSGAIRARPPHGFTFPIHWKCKDGYVTFGMHSGQLIAAALPPLVQWMDEVGQADDFLREMDWEAADFTYFTQPELDEIARRIAQFFEGYEKEELFREALKRKLLLFPVATIEDIVKSPQLKERDFFVTLRHPDLRDTIRYPGPFIKMSETPVHVRRRAPRIGEHNAEVYRSLLGLGEEDLTSLRSEGVV